MTFRSLILAGGGMRVAWQAGVMAALDEAGIEIGHVDGTSGGIINAAMLLSGNKPSEMCERWITLDVRRFFSPARLKTYLRGPAAAPAFGDADGIVDHVFPHLGVDSDRIRAAETPTGSFNVCNFNDKTNEVVPHTEIDLDVLVAGISLPIAMPVVEKDGVAYTDSVWIKDANLTEAVDRGATELWLAWCIGNTDRYGAGPLEQYVHMIEMSANGALFAELERIREINADRSEADEIKLHVIKPETPLPLDPIFFLGRIDAHTLCAMGYRDAKRYLAQMSEKGVALDHRVTKMEEPPLGVRFRETLHGRFEGLGRTRLRLGVELADGAGNVVGSIRSEGSARRWLWEGTAGIEGEEMVYRAMIGEDELEVRRRLGSGNLRDADVTYQGSTAGFRLNRTDALRALVSIEPNGAHGLVDRFQAIRSFIQILRQNPH